jgi:hypothetical protein
MVTVTKAKTEPLPGTMLPGSVLNPGGRRTTAIEQARAQLMPDLPKFLARLAELTQSSNESVRLGAIKECLDRLIGRSPIFVDSVSAKVDIGQLYLPALQRANAKTIDGSTENGATQTIEGEAEPK